jgi:predicted nucleic acid-binding protein
VLLAAKERQLVGNIGPVLDQLTAGGYRLSVALIRKILEKAGEV